MASTQKALGSEKAQGVISASLQSIIRGQTHLSLLINTEPAQLLKLQDEHPQTIAMILSYLVVLTGCHVIILCFASVKQGHVARRIAQML